MKLSFLQFYSLFSILKRVAQLKLFLEDPLVEDGGAVAVVVVAAILRERREKIIFLFSLIFLLKIKYFIFFIHEKCGKTDSDKILLI